MRLLAFLVLLGSAYAPAHAQTASVPWDEACFITAPEGGYVALSFGHEYLNPTTLEAGIIYKYKTFVPTLCGYNEVCQNDLQQHEFRLTLTYDESWHTFLNEELPWTHTYDHYVTVGLERVPDREIASGSTEEINYYGEYTDERLDNGGGSTHFQGSFNVCENLRLQLATRNGSETMCKNCDQFAKSLLELTYQGNGVLYISTPYETATQGLEGQDNWCAAMVSGREMTLWTALFGLIVMGVARCRRQ